MSQINRRRMSFQRGKVTERFLAPPVGAANGKHKREDNGDADKTGGNLKEKAKLAAQPSGN